MPANNPTKVMSGSGYPGGSTAKRLHEAIDTAETARSTMYAAAADIRFMRDEFHKLKEEMLDRIDGASDGPAFDSWLSEQIRTIDWILEQTR